MKMSAKVEDARGVVDYPLSEAPHRSVVVLTRCPDGCAPRPGHVAIRICEEIYFPQTDSTTTAFHAKDYRFRRLSAGERVVMEAI